MLILIYASVAQLDRAQDSDSWCRGFKSCQTRHVGAKFAVLRFSLAEKTSLCYPASPSSQKMHARFACSLVNVLTTAQSRYHLFVRVPVALRNTLVRCFFENKRESHSNDSLLCYINVLTIPCTNRISIIIGITYL